MRSCTIIVSRLRLVLHPARRSDGPPAGRRPSLAPPPTAATSAPTGVFSSWLTLATKSRRTASSRRSAVWSSASSRTRPLEGGEPDVEARAARCRGGRAGTSISSSRTSPSRRTCRASSTSVSIAQPSAADQAVAAAPRGWTGRRGRGSSSTTHADRSADSTASAPGAAAGDRGRRTGARLTASRARHLNSRAPRRRLFAWRRPDPPTVCEKFTARETHGSPGLTRRSPTTPLGCRHARAVPRAAAEISERLVEMTQLVGDAMGRATRALARRRPAGGRVGDRQRHRHRRAGRRPRGADARRHRPAGTGRRRPAHPRRAPCASARPSSGWATSPSTSPRALDAATPTTPCPRSCTTTIREMGDLAVRLVYETGEIIKSVDVAHALRLEVEDDRMDELHRQMFMKLLVPRLVARRRDGDRRHPDQPLLRALRRPRGLGGTPRRPPGDRACVRRPSSTTDALQTGVSGLWLAPTALAMAAAGVPPPGSR